MSDILTKLTYQTFAQGKKYLSFAHKNLSSKLLNFINPPVNQLQTKRLTPGVLQQLQEKLDQIIETDWQDAQKGIYPESLLFDDLFSDFWHYYPLVFQDLPQVRERRNQKQYQEFASGIETEGYPQYYLQNFHYQTDGYLSDMSANLYDLQVEILFNGTADAMRRRILAPLKEGLKTFAAVPPKEIRVLDVACGTGRTLKMVRASLPSASLFGIDLSPAYLRKANQVLSENPGELPQLIQANAEELPYVDNYFHGVTCVFSFHELPSTVRQRVIEECFRVTQPGGVLVICDSIQAVDYPELTPMMENFSIMFHEPYYRNYINDNFVERLEQAGFVNIATENHFVSKYWIAHKPQQ